MTAPLEGRVAIVTGAGRGIGRATAVLLGRAGADVACVARNAGEIAEAAVETRMTGATAMEVPADMGQSSDVTAAVERILDQFGKVDILVNNAAVVTPLGPTIAVEFEEWVKAIEVNLIGLMQITQLIVRGMLERRSGHVVNVSSGVAARPDGMIGANAYTTSKAALEACTLNLAAELADSGVHVNVLRPGTVDTAMQSWTRGRPAEEIGAGLRDTFVKMYEEGRLVEARQPAAVIVDLVSRDTTGRIIEARESPLYWP